MIYLGISGPIGHGKSALGSSLMRAEPLSQSGESSQVISEVADRLNTHFGALAILPPIDNFETVCDIIDTALIPAIAAVTPIPITSSRLTPANNELRTAPRQYDKLWTYLDAVREDPALLNSPITPENKENYRPILQWIGGYVTSKLERSLWCEELVRRTNSYEDCKLFIVGGVRFALDAEVIRQADGSIIGIERPDIPQRDKQDPTELARSEVAIDIKVINDGSLEQLDTLAESLLTDIYDSNPRDTYQAKAF